jgi:K+-sensing histidine kinase KdpD
LGVPLRKVESNGGAVTGSPLADELRSLAQLRMLHSLAQRLNELNDVRQIGEAITAELHTVIEYHNCRVHLLSEDGQMLVPIAFRGELSEYQGETFEALLIPFGAGITGRVAETGESHYAANTAEDPAAVNIAGTPDVDESLIVVPMRYGSNVIGTVALAKLGVDQFDDEDVRLLEVLAAHAAVAIENARLFERERNSAQVARELLKFSQTLTGAHDTESVLSEAIRTIPAMILCASVRVYLRDPTGAFHVAASVEGEAEAWAEPLVVPADVAQRFLLSTQEPFVLTMETIAAVPEPYRGRGDREAIIAPLHWEPDGFGAIAISGDPGAGPAGTGFSSRDLELARGIADIASLALGKAGRFRELEEAAERLRALDEMKNMFLDAVSHELRTPLAAVLGIALTLGRPEIDLSEPEARDLINRLQTNARKLERLLSDLLDLDRLVRGIVEPNRRPTDVGALVRGVVDAAELPGDHEITVQADTLVFPVDAAKVERIVENLLANAARHAPQATGIWVSATASDGGVLITVEDNGPGVPPELRAAVFEPFRQGPDRSQHSPGVGIGLSLVARFAEIHGGRAWVEDRPGGGASFRVFLPGA